MWRALDLGLEYRANFESAIESIQDRAHGTRVSYSSHWPLEMLNRSGKAAVRRVLVIGKVTNGFAQLHPTSAAVSAGFARMAGKGFNPLPDGNYVGGFWNFLVGRNGVFRPNELAHINLVWSNLYKIGRGYNHLTAGHPPWVRDFSKLVRSQSYSPRRPAPDGGIDNNPTAAERVLQDRGRMLDMLRHEIAACSPDVVICVCQPWLIEAAGDAGWAKKEYLVADQAVSTQLCCISNFLGTSIPALVGRHPIRIPGGLVSYATAMRQCLAETAFWSPFHLDIHAA